MVIALGFVESVVGGGRLRTLNLPRTLAPNTPYCQYLTHIPCCTIERPFRVLHGFFFVATLIKINEYYLHLNTKAILSVSFSELVPRDFAGI
jgi:hypothetical protein